MTRSEAADKIAEALEAGGYSASTWTTDAAAGPVRVYVTIPAESWKKKSRKIGYVSVELDGSISGDALDVQRGTILGLIPDLQIEAVAPVARPAVTVADRSPTDEDTDAFERSARSVAAAEVAREQG